MHFVKFEKKKKFGDLSRKHCWLKFAGVRRSGGLISSSLLIHYS
jgi:hypothetical protein